MGALASRLGQTDYAALVADEARAQGVDPNVAVSIMMAESSGNPNPPHRPGDGWGLMQVTEATAAWLTGHPVPPDDLLDPATNARLGVEYLRRQLDRYGGDVAAAVNAYRAGSASDTPLSQTYVRHVFDWLERLGGIVGIGPAGQGGDTGSPAPSSPGGAYSPTVGFLARWWPALLGGAVAIAVARRL